MIKTYKKRDLYLNKLRPYFDKNLIKVIIGQRRVGKSYLLYQIIDIIKKKKEVSIVYINKELNEFEFIKTHTDLLAYIKAKTKGRGKAYIFIDEIQEIAGFEKALRDLQARGKYDLYCTGSNANLLSGELATHLSGRYIEVKIFGLSYPEFLEFHKLKNSSAALMSYIKYGGLPYLINLELEDAVVYDYLRNIYNAILYKDVVRRFKIRNSEFLERLVAFLADNVGSLVSAKKISDFLKSQKTKMPPNVVLNYLTHLTQAFLVFKTCRSDIIGKRIFEIGEKYYFEDLGLRHSIVGYKQTDISKILENLVFLHLKTSGYNVTVGQLKNKEINFVCERGDEKIYVQVAYLISDEKIRDREFGNLLAIQDNYPKFVVSMDETAAGHYNGIKHVNVRDFLTKMA
ncbi:ATP-binding protein [Candidatus Saganbacteria bacterium]|nr:ATP-binding protein [Candidatus Saganbacteria bacterium]